MKMFKKSLALLFALLLCCTTLCSIFSVYAEDVEYGDNDIPCWDPEEEPEEPAYKIGDVNGDGQLSLGDASLMEKYILGSLPGDVTFILEAMDINDDGSESLGDVSILEKFILGSLSTEDANKYGLTK